MTDGGRGQGRIRIVFAPDAARTFRLLPVAQRIVIGARLRMLESGGLPPVALPTVGGRAGAYGRDARAVGSAVARDRGSHGGEAIRQDVAPERRR
jgi:hypothetical protein